MGYLHIENLYKNQTILLFKECYALEKIHGTSAHLSWKIITEINSDPKSVLHFSSGGESYENFIKLFDITTLTSKLSEMFPDQDVVIFGEAYGGKQQGMSHTYGKELKFIGFDVKVGDFWLNVPNAEDVCTKLGLEFVFYQKIEVTLENLTFVRDAPSVQAHRNLGLTDKKREGVVLRPLVEMRINNGDRVISKYKPDEQMETKTKREVSNEQLKVLTDANTISEEWVTNLRLEHVLQKFPPDTNMEAMGNVIKAMIEDVYREGKNEIVESKEVTKAIGSKTVKLFKQKLNNTLK